VAFPPPHPAFTTGYKVNFTFINNTPWQREREREGGGECSDRH
jgi:hypothetical protein